MTFNLKFLNKINYRIQIMELKVKKIKKYSPIKSYKKIKNLIKRRINNN